MDIDVRCRHEADVPRYPSGDDRQARATLDEMGTMTGTQIDAMLEG
jgi:hypothetical protein